MPYAFYIVGEHFFFSKRARRHEDDDNEEDERDEEKLGVRVCGNRILFYCDVTQETVTELVAKLQEVSTKLLAQHNSAPNPIILHINSDGGCLFSGLAAMDHVRTCVVPVHTVIDGFCASAATFIAVAGAKRYVQRHAWLLIHQMRTGFWGTSSELRDEAQNCEHMMRAIKRVYSTYSTMSAKKVAEIIQRELYFDSAECVKLGIADAIYE